jgi:hypothetical protein
LYEEQSEEQRGSNRQHKDAQSPPPKQFAGSARFSDRIGRHGAIPRRLYQAGTATNSPLQRHNFFPMMAQLLAADHL